MHRVCTICARGGSKGVPNKNTMLIAGKPLIAHSIHQAQEAGLFADIVVSSDSSDILDVATDCGAIPVRRPDALATDEAAKLPAIQHCIEAYEAMTGKTSNTCVDLDATSPLRLSNDIRACVELIEQAGAGNVITACPSRRSPYFNMVELDALDRPRLVKSLSQTVVRRQDSPKCFDMNASIYAWTRAALFGNASIFNDDTRLFVMPEERSIDIDSPLDFRIVSLLFEDRLSGAQGS